MAGVSSAKSQQEQQQSPNEAKEILKDSQKQDPEHSQRTRRMHETMGSKHADDRRGVGGQLPKHAALFPGEALTTANSPAPPPARHHCRR